MLVLAGAVVVLPVDVLPEDVLPVDVLPVDVLPVDVLPVDVLPVDVLPVDVLPVDVLPEDVLPEDDPLPASERAALDVLEDSGWLPPPPPPQPCKPDKAIKPAVKAGIAPMVVLISFGTTPFPVCEKA